MRTGKDLRGTAIVDVESGKKLGQADELVVSPDDLRLIALVMKPGGFLDKKPELFVAAEDIRSIGPDAVTVVGDRPQSLDGSGDEFRAARSGDRRLVGNKVVTRGGTLMGTVDDFVLDESTKQVVAVTVSNGVLTASQAIQADKILSVGPDVIVVDERAQRQAG